MKSVALEQTRSKKSWFVIEFSDLGFIGKLFKSSDLGLMAQFFLQFYDDKPVDWLLYDIISTKVCEPRLQERSDNSTKECKEMMNATIVRHRPCLFQHIGEHSSLIGKMHKLKG